jgi:uncharacterized protein YndB with AHSA1/START domain
MPESTTRSVIVQKEFPHSPDKVWRALTECSLIEKWLMKNDFLPETGHAFTLRSNPVPNWDGIIECKVVAMEPGKTLSYTWSTMGHASLVIFTLTPTADGTHVRVEQSGFRPDQEANYKGAIYGWRNFIAGLERVVAEIE